MSVIFGFRAWGVRTNIFFITLEKSFFFFFYDVCDYEKISLSKEFSRKYTLSTHLHTHVEEDVFKSEDYHKVKRADFLNKLFDSTPSYPQG